ncbi:MAG: Holliday junction branch migration protein RuvA [Bacteroidetes bacterium]|nr:Holliday junction branch migration protein RuvA [Bacteroidota bacterium]MCW5895059.1 Holliday junction branch migration protein RuvA [Bacteroidota bacterium]
MIASLRGKLLAKSPTELLLDVNGVGYAVSIPLSTFEKIGETGSETTLLTYLHVREDALQLYGFSTEEERNLFKLLISVSGIGPRMAQSILSGISASDLTNYISEGNHFALTRIPGIGKKIAERLVVELREKIGKMEMPTSLPPASSASQSSIRSEALLALTSLGFNRSVAEKALRAAIQETNGKDVTVEVLLKAALKHASGN